MSSHETRVKELFAQYYDPTDPVKGVGVHDAVIWLGARAGGTHVDAALRLLRSEETTRNEVRYEEEWERRLALRTAAFLGLVPMRARRGNTGMWRRVVYVEGPTSLTCLWTTLYQVHRDGLGRQLTAAWEDYALRALPYEGDIVEGRVAG